MTMPTNLPPQLVDVLAGAARPRWEGPGVHTVQTPAVGHDWSWSGPSIGAFKVLAVRATLTTSAAVANRHPGLTYTDRQGNVLAVSVPVASVTASETAGLTWAHGLTTITGAGTEQPIALADLWLPDGATVSVVTANIDVADQWSNVVVTYQVVG